MPIGEYHFRTGVSCMFEMATSDATRILPPHLQPVEVRHQRSILAINAFHVDESEVGAYVELTFAVIVPPIACAWGQHPKAGFYPFLAATSSRESREHRTERLRIPHLTESIDARFLETCGALRVEVWSKSGPVLELSVTQHHWMETSHLLHAFMMDGEQKLKADLRISGRYTVHENERGRMTLHSHPMTQALTLEEVSPYPFREHWLKEGVEVFQEVEAI